MIDPREVTAVLLTKGKVAHLVDVLPFPEIRVVRNHPRKIFGRYFTAAEVRTRYVYLQDDDCVVNVAALLEAYRPDEILCNVKPGHQADYAGTGISLVGWGAIFPRDLIAFDDYVNAGLPLDEVFDREADRVLTYLHREWIRQVWVGAEDLECALAPDRMCREDRHGADFREIRRRLAQL